MARATTVAERGVEVPLRHRDGCPAAEGRLYGDPVDPTEPSNVRKALGIEAFVVTGVGKYNKVTGEFEGVPKAGIVRCIECAEQVTVDAKDIPNIRKAIAAGLTAAEEDTDGG